MTDQQRVAVVTGGAGALGRQITDLLIEDGWSVVSIDRKTSSSTTPGVTQIGGDIRDVAVLEDACAMAEQLGVLTAWINNAATNTRARLDLASTRVIDEILDTDLRAAVLGAAIAVRSFLASGTPGVVINVSSIHAVAPFAGFAAYACAKAGLEALGRSICLEFGEFGVRSNTVRPGAIRTSSDTPASLARKERMSPMRTTATDIEVAGLVRFLLSHDARNISGQVFVIDAGATIGIARSRRKKGDRGS